jgi:hypothetical protein
MVCLSLHPADLNFAEAGSTGPSLPVAILPRTNQVMYVTMDSRLSLPVFKVRRSA